VTVITYIASDPQTQGLLAVPCVVGQLVQVFAGQPLANHLAARIARWRRANPATMSPAAAAAAGAAAATAVVGAAAPAPGKDCEAPVDGTVLFEGAADAANDVEAGAPPAARQ
jgi:hypothetical protein